jgi:hypothetical protein
MLFVSQPRRSESQVTNTTSAHIGPPLSGDKDGKTAPPSRDVRKSLHQAGAPGLPPGQVAFHVRLFPGLGPARDGYLVRFLQVTSQLGETGNS